MWIREIKRFFQNNNKAKIWLPIIIFFVIGLRLYANSFQNQMFWDDDDGILNNAFIKDWQYFPRYFSENLIAGAGLVSNYWRPVLLMVFSLEWHLWQDWTPGYHAVNTLVHIANAILIYFLLVKLISPLNIRGDKGGLLIPFLTALIFLIHPLQTEAVTYVSGLGDPLSSFFILLGLILFIKFRELQFYTGRTRVKFGYYAGALVCHVLALMTKEPSIVMPALILLVDFFYLREMPLRQRLKKMFVAVMPFILIDGIYTILRGTVLNFANTFNVYGEENLLTESYLHRLKIFFYVLPMYLLLLFAPIKLHMERTYEVLEGLNNWQAGIGLVITLVFVYLIISQYKKNPIISFGLLWFFIRLSPNSNLIVPNSGLMYEHWLYLPIIGIWLVVFYLITQLPKFSVFNSQFTKKLPAAAIFLLAIYFVFFGVQTVNRNAQWRDPITFYTQTMQFGPQSYRVINNLGMAYAKEKRHVEAETTYKKAIAVDPGNAVAHHNLANTYRDTFRFALAEAGYKKAIEQQPDFFFSYQQLHNLYIGLAQGEYYKKDYAKAISYLKKGLELYPENTLIQQEIAYLEELIAKGGE